MAKSVRKKTVREAALSDVKDDLSRYLREAERGDIVSPATASRPAC